MSILTLNTDTVELSGGVRLPFVEQGDDDGVPVLMLHGVTDSWRSFAPVLPHLPSWIHAYAITQRGHGDASRPARYALDDFATDVVGFMDALGLASAVVVGHSMGTIVASRLAADHPDRVDGLVLACAATTFVTPDTVEMSRELHAMDGSVDLDFIREFQVGTMATEPSPEFLEMVVGESARLPIEVWRGAWDDAVLADYAGDLPRIAAPTLVTWGDQDNFCSREEQSKLVAAIPNSRIRVHEGRGHAVHWDDPAAFAGDVATFADAVRR
jgi:pimeloyl-ACP methyl ester carboxylesterase